ncbi:flagellar hook protein FlgE [Brevundimonas sp.]|uniref:flagellar hook protein FlgE n=1 Tax=Brevundimonas sp. TaxID=1871086 RepID=UPI003F707D7A
MSINSAMQAGVAGLSANSAALAAISQNIANVNTVGYKRVAGEFSTVMNSQTRGSGYAAGGVATTARHFISQEGQLTRTVSSTDLGVSGQGFFVVTEKADNLTATDSRLFTRAGAFTKDNQGYLRNTAGLYLQGWPVDSDGNIQTDPSDLTRLRSINIGTVGGTAEPTTRVQLNANLWDSQPVSPYVAPVAKNDINDSATPVVQHDYRVQYEPTGVANQWNVTIREGSNPAITGTVTYDAAGNLTASTLPGGSLTTLQIGAGPPAVTVPLSGLGLTTSADAKARYDPATNAMAMWDPDATPPKGVKPDFELTIPVSDSKGGQRTVAISFLKSDTPNEWYAEIRAVPASDVETGTGLTNGQLRTGRLAFTQDGRLDIAKMQTWPAGTGLFDDPTNATISFGASDGAAPGAGEAKWATGLGIDNQVITFDLNTSAGGLSQLNTPSVVLSTITNGTAFGNLSEIKIDEKGFVTAIFDNGVMRKIAQVALATFPSPDNLTEVSGNAYRVSQGSGTFNLKTAGTGGSGFIRSGQLEASAVDLSEEFTGLITTQRAYSASSKIITTADEMLAELINIKR